MQNKSFNKNIVQGVRLRINKIFHNPYRIVNVSPLKKIYYKHLNPGKVRIHKLLGKPLSFYNSTELLHGLKEIFIDEIYKQNLSSTPYIIDCGAHIGLSVIYMKNLYPHASILAFEPDEKNFDLLKKNVENFGFEEVDIRREAVWIENATIQFASEGSMTSHIGNAGPEKTISVKAIRLKDYICKPVDFLKIDIEGAEYRVMKDISDQLHFVKHLFLEYHGTFEQNPELTELFDLLVEKGFNYYIKEAASVYNWPLYPSKKQGVLYDVQLNIFCIKK
jgi:FkbM family methyltransferase